MMQLNDVINQIKLKYAPDKRVAIFNIQTEEVNKAFVLKGETNMVEAKDELIKSLKSKNYTLTDAIDILPSKELGEMTYGVVNLSVANIRTNPENSAEMATQALLGTPLKIYKKNHGYYLVQTPDQYIAWTDNDAVELMDKKTFEQWTNSQLVIFLDFYGFSYSNPDENSEHVSDLVKGNTLRLIEEKNGFCKVEYPDKRIAYVPSKSCQKYEEWINSREITADNLIKTAKKFMGIPYLWGGTSTKGVDCSGFTKSVYFQNGVQLPRDASQQVFVGDPIDTKDGFDKLQPGDLLFFGRRATDTTQEKVVHVAMYIGNGEFIHSSGRVRINSLDKTKENFSEYRFNTFLRAKRILTSLDKNGVVLLKNIKSNAEVHK